MLEIAGEEERLRGRCGRLVWRFGGIEHSDLSTNRGDGRDALDERDGLLLNERVGRKEGDGRFAEERNDARAMRLAEELSRSHAKVVDRARRRFSFVLVLNRVEV